MIRFFIKSVYHSKEGRMIKVGKTIMKSRLIGLILLSFLLFPSRALARDFGMGVHILHPDELSLLLPYRGSAEKFYVTVPYLLSDRRISTWNSFFQLCRENRITPIIRLSSDFDFDAGHWKVPNRREIIEGISFLSSLEWQGERIVVLFNEPNHAKEWGGSIDPEGYADVAMFVASWLHTEPLDYVVLPAGLDASAPNSGTTMDSFLFWDWMFSRQPDLVNWINGWTSHSYPNPGFVGSPYSIGKQSLRGFEEELNYLRRFSKQDLPVYITETGWRQTKSINRVLASYFDYAYKNIWSHPQVRAVTVFLLQGSPGPFEEFSLLTPLGTPTPQLNALNQLLFLPISP
jgi:hypothetical protein